MKYVLILIAILFSNQAVALDCSKQPTCEELGYSTQDNPNCFSDGYLICPFDSQYKKCVNFNCESLGFTQSDKTSWCKNIATCPNNKDYTACIKATCDIGDIYYADGSCGLVDDYNGSKTPVGVVYYVSDGGYHGKVINLHDLGREATNKPFNSANPYDTRYRTLYWGYYNYDLEGLENYTSSNIVDKLKAYDEDLYDGKGNTDKILAAEEPNCSYEDSTYQYYQHCMPQAAQAAHDFYPQKELENDSKVGKGRWYLPALGELMDLYGYDNTQITSPKGKSGAKGNNKTLVNNTLDALKGKGVVAEKLTENYYWSSSEYAGDHSWKLLLDNGNRFANDKNVDNYVRASLAF